MDFSRWDRDKLVKYLSFLFRSYRAMDAFWFINIEQRHGLEEACRINELVWGKIAQLDARDLKKRFNLTGQGLEGFVEAQRLFPWCILVNYQIDQRPNEVLITVPTCPPQRARLERNLGEYPCQAMHRVEFEAFAGEIDPHIRVECLFAPPDEHPPDLFCKWRFTLVGDREEAA